MNARRLVLAGLGVWLCALPFEVKADESCFDATITAYDWESWPGRMADGNYTGDYVGEAVAGSSDIPMHASVWIDGLGTFTKRDTGGGLYRRHIDYLVWTYAEAIEFGRQYRTVCVGETNG